MANSTLQRSARLKSHKGLARGPSSLSRSPLAPGKPPRRHVRVKRVSDKARALRPARAACIAAVKLRSGGRCEAAGFSPDCAKLGCDTHEKLSRAMGGSITDPSNCLFVCRPCHDEIPRRRDEAIARGLLVGRNKGRAAA